MCPLRDEEQDEKKPKAKSLITMFPIEHQIGPGIVLLTNRVYCIVMACLLSTNKSIIRKTVIFLPLFEIPVPRGN